MTDTHTQTAQLVERLVQAGLMVATAESCTGGLIAAALTNIPGSSAVVDRGFVTYSNGAKHGMLGIEMALIQNHGAVSAQVALAMAEQALARSQADIALSVTGIAGPSGGTADKPVGTVHFGCARKGRETLLSHQLFADKDRTQVRQASLAHGLTLIKKMI